MDNNQIIELVVRALNYSSHTSDCKARSGQFCTCNPVNTAKVDNPLSKDALFTERDEVVRKMWGILNKISYKVKIDDFTKEDSKLWTAVTEHSAVQNKLAPGMVQQVVEEKRELDEKATKMSNFIGLDPIFENIDTEEQERMKEQCETMWEYSEILGKRIAAVPSI